MSHEAQADTLTDDQIHGRACRECGAKEAPLHPDETLVTRPYADVIRETVSVLCTGCLVADR